MDPPPIFLKLAMYYPFLKEFETNIAKAAIAGAIGGSSGDFIMHSVDTVKTRQQAAPHIPKYNSMGRAYWSIFREEGVRGLYGGALPMLLGSCKSP